MEKKLDCIKLFACGVVSTREVTRLGIHRRVIQEMVNNGELARYARGLYTLCETWEDEFFLLQQKYSRGIFSYDTALYLLGYSDRAPIKITMSFPKGYNAPSLKSEDVIVKRLVQENYSFGITEIQSPSGNTIRVFDLERTLCDILRGKGSDLQIVLNAMKKYTASKEKDLLKLMSYAEKLHVKPKVMRYLEVLL